MIPRTLESLCSVNPEALGAGTPQDFEFRYLDISSVTKGKIDWKAMQIVRFSESPSRARRIVRRGDVLLCTVRPRLQSHAIIHDDQAPPVVCSTGFAVLRPREDTDSSYIFHSLFGEPVAAQLRGLETGSNYPAVNENDVRRLRVPTSSPPEMRRIGAVLDSVDEAIAKTEAVIAKLKQVRAGLLHDLLTRGLDEHGQLRDLIAHPEKFQQTLRGILPRNWELLTLQAATQPEAPICYGIVQAFDYVEEGVPVLAIKDLGGDYRTGLHRTAARIDAAYSRSKVRPGDVLLSIKGTIGRVGVVPDYFMGNISRDLARLRPGDSVDSSFLRHMLLSPIGQRTLELARVGTTRAELSIGPLRLLSFPFPPLQEQQAIVCILDAQDGALRVEENALAKLLELKSGLMSDLLTGRVRVPEGLA